MASINTNGLKSWNSGGETYYLFNGGQQSVYSYNDLVRMVNEFGNNIQGSSYVKDRFKSVAQQRLNYVLKTLNKVGIGTDEPILSEAAASALDPKKAITFALGRGNKGLDGSDISNWSAAWTPYIMTENEYRKEMKGTLADKIAKGAIIAGGIVLTAGGLSGAIGGVSPVTGEAIAGSLWSPTGASVATSGTGLATGGSGVGLTTGGGTGLTTTGAALGGEGLATGTGLTTGTGGLGLKVGGGLGLVEGGGLGLKAVLPEVAMSGGGFFSKLGSVLGSAFGGPAGRLLTNIIGGWVADKFTDGPFDGYNIDPSRIDDYMSKAEDAIRLATERNEELFNYRFGKAKQLIDEESGYFNPDYFAQQSMARARNMNAAARREGLRGVTGDAAANLSRKYDLDAVRGMGTAYDSGYATGVQGRLQTMTTGLQFLPNEYPNYSRDYAALAGPYLDMERLKMEMAKANWDAKHRNAAGIGKLGGDAIDFGTDMFRLVGKGIDKGIDFIGKLWD